MKLIGHKKQIKKPVNRKISLIQLIGLIFAFFCSIRNVAQVAMGGLSSILWIVLSIIFFVIPIAFITTELATGWTVRGGESIWARQAFGKRTGLLVGWLLWVQMFSGMTIMLVVLSTMLAYVAGNPIIYSFVLDKHVHLSDEPFYLLMLSIGLYWIITIINLYVKNSNKKIVSIGTIVGIYIPFICLILFGVIFIIQQAALENYHLINNIQNTFIPVQPDNGILPSQINNLSIFSQIMWIFIGLEMASARINDIDNPKKTYPTALLISLVLIVILIFSSGFIFAAIVPFDEIALQAGVILPFEIIFDHWNIPWMTNILATCIAVGTFAHLNSWLLGPSNTMYSISKEGTLPLFFQKVNKNNVPVSFLFIQAISITLFSCLYFGLSLLNASNVFGIILNQTIIVYCIAYLIIISAFLKLKYSQPDVIRTVNVPGKKIGAWTISIFGYLGVLLAITLCFLQNQSTLELLLYQDILVYVGITSVMISVPLIISTSKKFKDGSWTSKTILNTN